MEREDGKIEAPGHGSGGRNQDSQQVGEQRQRRQKQGVVDRVKDEGMAVGERGEGFEIDLSGEQPVVVPERSELSQRLGERTGARFLEEQIVIVEEAGAELAGIEEGEADGGQHHGRPPRANALGAHGGAM